MITKTLKEGALFAVTVGEFDQQLNKTLKQLMPPQTVIIQILYHNHQIKSKSGYSQIRLWEQVSSIELIVVVNKPDGLSLL